MIGGFGLVITIIGRQALKKTIHSQHSELRLLPMGIPKSRTRVGRKEKKRSPSTRSRAQSNTCHAKFL